MQLTKLNASHMSCSRWSGGTTTQIAICPAEAIYAERNFIWRLSSAVVELPESDFTPLPDYDRILMILDGELALSHDGGQEYTLRTLEQTSFDGASHTFSRGQVTDFNLMMRKGSCRGQVESIRLNSEMVELLPQDHDTALYYCVSGEATVTLSGTAGETLSAGDALLIEKHLGEAVTLTGSATLIRADMAIS